MEKSFHDVDKYIEHLKKCQPLPEHQVKDLCEKVSLLIK
jgi:hypothetical protein